MELLIEYEFEIKYMKEKANKVVDALSRIKYKLATIY